MAIYLLKHPFKSLLYVSMSSICLLFTLIGLTYMGVFGKLPTKNYLMELKTPLTSTLYASNKEQIGLYYLQNRSNLDSTAIPQALKNALIATEDVRFYEHKGIDYRSYGRVFIKSVILQQNAGGGSTLTQQVAKNTFGRQRYWLLTTPINKIKEIFIARRLESIYTKDEILLLYLNTVTFGENIYGIEKAAFRFFNKKPENLSVAECATLVGLLKAPTYYNPRNHPQRATQRRDVVLKQMVVYGFMTQEEMELENLPLKLAYQAPKKTVSTTTYFKEYVAKEFTVWAQENPATDGRIYNLETDGLRIYTTLNTSVQKSAEKAMTRQMIRLQDLINLHWDAASTEGGKQALLEKIITQTTQFKNWKAQGKTDAEIEQLQLKKSIIKIPKIGNGFDEKLGTLEDSIAATLTRLHTGILALDSRSGRIMSYVGGIGYGISQRDNVTTAYQVGSTFKPITYLAAIKRGKDPCTYYDNSLRTYAQYENWKPRNANGSYGGSYSMHGALANSVNTVSVQIQLETGVERTQVLAEKMGIKTTLPAVPSIVLGTGTSSLLEMVTAYASISNGGRRVTPFAIERIETADGTILYQAKPKLQEKVAKEEHIKVLQQMMGAVLTEGTASRIQGYEIPYNLIGKTGTTQNNGDGWFIACSPEIVVGAWVGTYDKRVHFKNTSMGSGANTALPIVASVFKSLSAWKKPVLTQFTYEQDYFNCPPFLEMEAKEAFEFAKTDTTYIYQKKAKDSLLLDNTLQTLDSIEPIPKTINDNIAK